MTEKENQIYSFCALLSRMKYIGRWGLMRQSRNENLSEHTSEAAILGHILALIAKEECGMEEIRPEKVAVAALYHDASEILTGDLPTPVKYKNEELMRAYKAVEHESAEALAGLLPPNLESVVEPYLTGSTLCENEKKLLKAADGLCALIKCIEEETSGNKEFRSARAQHMEQLTHINHPAVNIFLRQYLPFYEKNLDELVTR